MPTYREKRLVTRIKVTNIKGIYKQLVYFNTSFLTFVITNQEQCDIRYSFTRGDVVLPVF